MEYSPQWVTNVNAYKDNNMFKDLGRSYSEGEDTHRNNLFDEGAKIYYNKKKNLEY